MQITDFGFWIPRNRIFELWQLRIFPITLRLITNGCEPFASTSKVSVTIVFRTNVKLPSPPQKTLKNYKTCANNQQLICNYFLTVTDLVQTFGTDPLILYSVTAGQLPVRRPTIQRTPIHVDVRAHTSFFLSLSRLNVTIPVVVCKRGIYLSIARCLRFVYFLFHSVTFRF